MDDKFVFEEPSKNTQWNILILSYDIKFIYNSKAP